MDGGNIALDTAIGLHDDEPLFPSTTLLLKRNDVEMVWIYLRNEHRYIESGTMRRGVGKNGHACGRVRFLRFSYHVFIRHFKGREDESAFRWCWPALRAAPHDVLGHTRRFFPRHNPPAFERVLIFLSG